MDFAHYAIVYQNSIIWSLGCMLLVWIFQTKIDKWNTQFIVVYQTGSVMQENATG